MSEAVYVLYRKENRVLSDLGIYPPEEAAVSGGLAPERVASATVTGSVFNVLGVPSSPASSAAASRRYASARRPGWHRL